MPGFTVDTHLLRELGELLVGRDSTALLELIKNSYDADATEVLLHAEGLGTEAATLRIVDNGNGMTYERFHSAFLRIAGRDKEGDVRRSPRFGRRYTGQKGIGRLAAHKLAAALQLVSVPRGEISDGAGVSAFLDWDAIEAQETLNDLRGGIQTERISNSTVVDSGTSIELRRLRTAWTDRQLALFVSELKSAQPPRALADPEWPLAALASEKLIRTPLIRDVVNPGDPGFNVTFGGDLEIGDDLWDRAADNFQWLIEIDGLRDSVKYRISPLQSYAKEEPEARSYYFEGPVTGDQRPRFQARIFTYPNSSARRGPLAGFVRSSSGVRVYLEGFRVLPYGEYGDDWLEIDRDYRNGPRFYKIDIDQHASDVIESDSKEALAATSNLGYFGAVFLTDANSRGLKSLVNREGFVPDAAYEELKSAVQTGIRLSVRVRRAVASRISERERSEIERQASAQAEAETSRAGGDVATRLVVKGQSKAADSDGATSEVREAAASQHRVSDTLAPAVVRVSTQVIIERARSVAEGLRVAQLPLPQNSEMEALVAGFDAAQNELERLRSLQPDLRVLASVGLQLGAFVHDVNGMLGQATTVRQLLEPLSLDPSIPPRGAQRLRRVLRALDDLSHSLARQSSYLTDVLVTDPRRRRSRIRLKDRLAVVERLLHSQLAQRGVSIEDLLESELLTP
ncbi:ATP-binding protein, partial [Micromonospora chalcea]